MASKGQDVHAISLDDAAELTRNYRKQNPDGIKAEYFRRDAIENILAQKGCAGIRVYYGMDNDFTPKLVLVGADLDGNDLTEIIAEKGAPCPPLCGPDNRLNS